MGRQRLFFVFCAVGAAVGSVLVAGCSSDDDGSSSSSPGSTSALSTTSSTATTAPGLVTSTTVPGAATSSTVAGGAGESTTTAAGGATSTTAAGRVVTSPQDSVHNGDTGPGVEQIQTALNAYGYKLGVDGQFGNVTETAVRDFQGKNGLGVDGVVGPKTWAKLQVPPSSTGTTVAGTGTTTATTTGGAATTTSTAPATTAGP